MEECERDIKATQNREILKHETEVKSRKKDLAKTAEDLTTAQEKLQVVYTLHPTPYTPHPTPYTLHPTPYTPHQHLTPCTAHAENQSLRDGSDSGDSPLRCLTRVHRLFSTWHALGSVIHICQLWSGKEPGLTNLESQHRLRHDLTTAQEKLQVASHPQRGLLRPQRDLLHPPRDLLHPQRDLPHPQRDLSHP